MDAPVCLRFELRAALKKTYQAVANLAHVCALFALVMMMSAMERPPSSGQIQISIEQLADGRLRITYEMERVRRSLEFLEIADEHRKLHWKIESSGFRLVKNNHHDRIEKLNNTKFKRIVISAKPHPERLKKEYQPISRYGVGGVMVYNGHFWPVNSRGRRLRSTFNFTPVPGAQVVAFGEHKDSFVAWDSPLAHPAFIYMGPLHPVETPEVMAVIDPTAPQWIKDEFYELTPRVFTYLGSVFGVTLATKPNLFLAAPLGDDEGRLSYAGDALPGQFQVTLVGAAWKNRTKQSINIFRSSTVHEAVHLWQAAAKPKANTTAAWIHEGAADAIASEVLLATDYWEAADYEDYFIGAQDECARGLKLGALTTASKRQNFKALYACGHVIAQAVSIAERKSVSNFWREFITVAQEENGYSENTYFDLALKRTGNVDFVERLRYFVRTPLANPDREIDRLLASAQKHSADTPLAPTGGR